MDIKERVISVLFKGLDEEYVLDYLSSSEIESIDLFDDLGFESIRFITAIVELENHFDIEIPDDYLSVENLSTVGAIVSMVSSIIKGNDLHGD